MDVNKLMLCLALVLLVAGQLPAPPGRAIMQDLDERGRQPLPKDGDGLLFLGELAAMTFELGSSLDGQGLMHHVA